MLDRWREDPRRYAQAPLVSQRLERRRRSTFLRKRPLSSAKGLARHDFRTTSAAAEATGLANVRFPPAPDVSGLVSAFDPLRTLAGLQLPRAKCSMVSVS